MKEKHYCLQCGKEISSWRKFCSNSCSAIYNNLRRKRKPWTDEQKEKVVKNNAIKHGIIFEEAVCKYCGKPLGKIVNSRFKEGVCEECRPYLKRLKTFKKLNLLEKGKTLQEVDRELLNLLVDLYYREKESVTSIYKKTGIHHTSLKKLFNEYGLTLRSISDGLKIGLEQERVKPVFCEINHGHGLYLQGYHLTWEGKKIFYRSGYELSLAEFLDRNKISYDVESLRIKYFDSQRQVERIAIPDFYLPVTNEILEVKSTFTLNLQEMKDKFKAYENLGYSPRLILNHREVNLYELEC